jgi:hypothetical protein
MYYRYLDTVVERDAGVWFLSSYGGQGCQQLMAVLVGLHQQEVPQDHRLQLLLVHRAENPPVENNYLNLL